MPKPGRKKKAARPPVDLLADDPPDAPPAEAAPADAPPADAPPADAPPAEEPPPADAPPADAGTELSVEGVTLEDEKPARDPRYPLTVLYCPVCKMPAELHEYHSNNQFQKCSDWLRRNAPYLFPDKFPEEAAAWDDSAAAEAEAGNGNGNGGGGGDGGANGEENDAAKVAVPIEQKTSGGKKKKAAAEIVLTLAQRKGKKQVTVVYGLDLFGIKLKDAAKAAKRKFATGSSLATSPDNRDVIEIQGSRQDDMAALVHKEWGVPRDAIFIVNAQKKKVAAFA